MHTMQQTNIHQVIQQETRKATPAERAVALALSAAIKSGVVEFEGTFDVLLKNGVMLIDPFNKNPSVFEFPDVVTVFSHSGPDLHIHRQWMRALARIQFDKLTQTQGMTKTQ